MSKTNFTLLYLKYVDGCLLSGLVKNRTHVSLSITNFTLLLYLKYVDGSLLSGLVKNRTHVLVYNQLYITVFKICGCMVALACCRG